MRAQERNDRETRLFERANAHEGLLHHDHLTAEGLNRSDIGRRLAAHRLTRIHDKVYAFGHIALRPEAYWLAALWTFGRGAVLSHTTAAAFHGWSVQWPQDTVHLSTTRALRSRDGITVHRVRHLDRVDVFHDRAFAVTHVPRTLVDLADVLAWTEYRALADSLPYLAVTQIRAAQLRTPKRPGAPLVTRLIEADDAHTKSEFERRFLALVTSYGLPRPDDLNVRVAGHKADCVYRTEPRLVVELDGRAYHQRRAAMRADRQRDSDYQLDGFRILRLVWDDLHPNEASATARRLRRMLAPADA
jgi:hypothetical protein